MYQSTHLNAKACQLCPSSIYSSANVSIHLSAKHDAFIKYPSTYDILSLCNVSAMQSIHCIYNTIRPSISLQNHLSIYLSKQMSIHDLSAKVLIPLQLCLFYPPICKSIHQQICQFSIKASIHPINSKHIHSSAKVSITNRYIYKIIEPTLY